jgi:hypothetical protein
MQREIHMPEVKIRTLRKAMDAAPEKA